MIYESENENEELNYLEIKTIKSICGGDPFSVRDFNRRPHFLKNNGILINEDIKFYKPYSSDCTEFYFEKSRGEKNGKTYICFDMEDCFEIMNFDIKNQKFIDVTEYFENGCGRIFAIMKKQ